MRARRAQLGRRLHVHPPTERRALQIRLRKVGGQLRAIENMLEGDHDCSEVLTQLVSARRGLKSLSESAAVFTLNRCDFWDS